MSQFYVSIYDVDRCRKSMLERAVITIKGATAATIKGATAAGELKTFTGIVLSLDEDRNRPTRSRWLIALQETESPRDG